MNFKHFSRQQRLKEMKRNEDDCREIDMSGNIKKQTKIGSVRNYTEKINSSRNTDIVYYDKAYLILINTSK